MSWRMGLVGDPQLRQAWRSFHKGSVSEAKSLCNELPLGPGRTFLELRIAFAERDLPQFEDRLAASALDRPELAVARSWKLVFLRVRGRDDEALKSELNAAASDPSLDMDARREIALRLFVAYQAERSSRADLVTLLLEDDDLNRKALFEQLHKVRPLDDAGRYADAIQAARRAIVLVDLSEEQSIAMRTVLLENIAGFAIANGNGAEALSACMELHATLEGFRAPEAVNPGVYLNCAIRLSILGYFDEAYELCRSVQGRFAEAPLDPAQIARCWIAVCAGDTTIGRIELNEALELANRLDANVDPVAVQQLDYLVELCLEVDIDKAEALLEHVAKIRKTLGGSWPIAADEVSARLHLISANISSRRGDRQQAMALAAGAFDELTKYSHWGAVRCALLLCQMTGDATWLERAKQLAEGFGPRFFLLPQIAAIEEATVGSPLAQLTPRQRTIAKQLASGKAPMEIAREIGISTNTVRVHMQAVYRAFSVKTRAQLVLALFGASL